MSEAEARRRLEGARVARLATAGSEGRPHLVPICFALDGDTVYSAVDRKPKRTADLKRLQNVRANPRVSVLVDGYDEDWSRLWWVRLDGLGRIVEEELERARALGLLQAKYEQYRGEAPQGPVLAVEIERLRGWAAT